MKSGSRSWFLKVFCWKNGGWGWGEIGEFGSRLCRKRIATLASQNLWILDRNLVNRRIKNQFEILNSGFGSVLSYPKMPIFSQIIQIFLKS
jgi:hypothetical protein